MGAAGWMEHHRPALTKTREKRSHRTGRDEEDVRAGGRVPWEPRCGSGRPQPSTRSSQRAWALQARIRTFQTAEENAQRELQTRTQQLQSTQANVNQQISTRLIPIIEAVRNARGAALVVDKGATLASASNIDVTNDVLAQLNQQLPSVSVTPLPQQPAAARPQGR